MERLWALKKFELVPPAIPISFTKKRRQSTDSLILNTNCKWCQKNPRPTYRHHYCSEVCATSCYLSLNPQSRAGCAYLLTQQDFKCNICTYSYLDFLIETATFLLKHNRPIRFDVLGPQIPGKYFNKDRSGPIPCQVDHKVRISKGGEGFGFSNLQAICIDCHLIKTKKDKTGIYF